MLPIVLSASAILIIGQMFFYQRWCVSSRVGTTCGWHENEQLAEKHVDALS
jgi:hypothetical protein